MGEHVQLTHVTVYQYDDITDEMIVTADKYFHCKTNAISFIEKERKDKRYATHTLCYPIIQDMFV